MGKCQKCGEPDINNSGRCKKHPKTKLELDNEKKQAAIKVAMAKKLAETADARVAMAEKAKKIEEDAKAKKAAIATIASTWNGQVKTVVNQVLLLRKNNPAVTTINAGTNAAGTTLGGKDNPVKFVLPSANPCKVARGEVFPTMAGFDSSDSGLFKFRVSNVLVHGQ